MNCVKFWGMVLSKLRESSLVVLGIGKHISSSSAEQHLVEHGARRAQHQKRQKILLSSFDVHVYYFYLPPKA